MGSFILLCRLLLWRSAVRTGKSQTLDYRYYIYFNIACNNRNITSEVRIEAIKNFIHLFINNNSHQIKHLKNNLMYSYL